MQTINHGIDIRLATQSPQVPTPSTVGTIANLGSSLLLPRLIWLLLVFLFTSPAGGESFRIVVLPDSQNASDAFPEVLDATCDWIAANKEKLNIQYVLHVGDMVERGADERMWNNFDHSMKRLEKGGVPYVLAVGNHDFGKPNGQTNRLTLFEQHFPVTRFNTLPSFGGSAPEGSNANSYHVFRAGGVNWLVVSLVFNPPDYILDWAGRVIKAHPSHSVILLTHSYLEHKGRDVSGERIWNKLARHYGNISMVICGHLSTVNYVDKGDQGNTVYQMLFDWQNPTSAEMNSYCAVLELDPEKHTISVTSYSAKFDKYLEARNCKFQFEDVQFMTRGPAPKVVIVAPQAPPPSPPMREAEGARSKGVLN
jgi:hypothetical protein